MAFYVRKEDRWRNSYDSWKTSVPDDEPWALRERRRRQSARADSEGVGVEDEPLCEECQELRSSCTCIPSCPRCQYYLDECVCGDRDEDSD